MNFEDKQGQIIGVVVALIVLVVGVVLWQRASSGPAIPPGQTLANPLGNTPDPMTAPQTQPATTAVAPATAQ